jgi:hypothetical protein
MLEGFGPVVLDWQEVGFVMQVMQPLITIQTIPKQLWRFAKEASICARAESGTAS